MKKQTTYSWVHIAVLLFFFFGTAYAAPKIDPIKFTVTTNATNLSINEEFEITITGEYLNIPSNTAYVLKDANNFKLKLTFPEGFVKTGGNYSDFVGAELGPTNPRVSYTVKGKFVSAGGEGTFELLRSHKNADTQSTFVAVGRLSFTPQTSLGKAEDSKVLRVAASGFVPYMTISDLQSGAAANAEAVVITDPLKMGLFVLDPADATSADDGAMVLRDGSKRYKRVFQEHINPRWFGATGDGTTDDTNNFKSAVLFAKNKSKTLLIESGSTFVVKSDVDFYSNVEGYGTINTRSSARLFIKQAGVTFKDITILGRDASNANVISGNGIYVNFVDSVVVNNVKIRGVGNRGIYGVFSKNSKFTNNYISDLGGVDTDGMLFAFCYNTLVEGNTISKYSRGGIVFEAYTSNNVHNPSRRPIVKNNMIRDAISGGTQVPSGVHLENCLGGIVEGNRIENTLRRGVIVNVAPLSHDTIPQDYIIANNSIINVEIGISALGGEGKHVINIATNTFSDCGTGIELAEYETIKIANCIFNQSQKAEEDLGSLIKVSPTKVAGKRTSLFIEGCVNSRTMTGEKVGILFTNSSGFKCDFVLRDCVGNFSVKQYGNYLEGTAKISNVFMDYSTWSSTGYAFCNFKEKNIYTNCNIKFASSINFNLQQPVEFTNCSLYSDSLFKMKVGLYGANYIKIENSKLVNIVLTDIIRLNSPLEIILIGNTISGYGSSGFLENVTQRLGYLGLTANKFTSTTDPTATPIQLTMEAIDSDIGPNSHRSAFVTNMPNPRTTVPWSISITTTTNAASKSYLNTNYGNLKGGSIITFPNISTGNGGAQEYRKLSDSNTSDWVRTYWTTGLSGMLP